MATKNHGMSSLVLPRSQVFQKCIICEGAQQYLLYMTSMMDTHLLKKVIQPLCLSHLDNLMGDENFDEEGGEEGGEGGGKLFFMGLI